jgi:hypothetical protein
VVGIMIEKKSLKREGKSRVSWFPTNPFSG